jgi:aldehyde:ferredoxin oxidoreductase
LAFRLFEKGVIDSKDTGGLELRFGDAGMVEKLLHQMVKQEGFGAMLSQGARALGARFGAEEEAVQVNGLEVPYHDPRGASGMALVYAISPRGACHNQSDYFMVDIGQVESSLGMGHFDRLGGAEKAANVAIHQDWRTLANSLVLCLFSNVEPPIVRDLINTACGLDLSVEDVLRVGERGWNLKRAINNRLGLTHANDILPKALMQPFQDAQTEEQCFVPDLKTMLEAYYQARGWDPQTGYPTQEKLHELDLDFVIKDLYIHN